MYILTNVSQDCDGMVYAGFPTLFDTEETAINSARKQLADDFGIDEETVEYEAQMNGTPYTLSMSRDGRLEAYTVQEVKDHDLIEKMYDKYCADNNLDPDAGFQEEFIRDVIKLI